MWREIVSCQLHTALCWSSWKGHCVTEMRMRVDIFIICAEFVSLSHPLSPGSRTAVPFSQMSGLQKSARALMGCWEKGGGCVLQVRPQFKKLWILPGWGLTVGDVGGVSCCAAFLPVSLCTSHQLYLLWYEAGRWGWDKRKITHSGNHDYSDFLYVILDLHFKYEQLLQAYNKIVGLQHIKCIKVSLSCLSFSMVFHSVEKHTTHCAMKDEYFI